MKRNIVIITDCADIAYNELRGVMLGIIDECKISIEPVVSVCPMSILNGNFVVRLMAEAYPENTVFSIVLNPSQQRPARLIGRTKKKSFFFMGANTGVFTWLFRDFGVSELYELTDPGFFPFGGKYVHAPAVAQIAMGKPLKDMGHSFAEKDVVHLDIVSGTVIHVDNFGLMKFTGELTDLKEGDKLRVTVNGTVLDAIFTKRMMGNNTGTWTIYPGSSLGLPELGKVRGNGAAELNVKVGDVIKFEKL